MPQYGAGVSFSKMKRSMKKKKSNKDSRGKDGSLLEEVDIVVQIFVSSIFMSLGEKSLVCHD